jgi:polyhydroxyalkanoate synthesis regulator phasin
LEAARTFNTEVENRIHSLIKRNEINAEEGKNLIEKLLSVGAPPPPVEDDIPTRDDILKLSAQIDALTKEIESLEAEQEE